MNSRTAKKQCCFDSYCHHWRSWNDNSYNSNCVGEL